MQPRLYWCCALYSLTRRVVCFDSAGFGVEQDYSQAVEWYNKAAEQGNGDAQMGLYICYQFGYGVKQSDAKAAYRLAKAEKTKYNDLLDMILPYLE